MGRRSGTEPGRSVTNSPVTVPFTSSPRCRRSTAIVAVVDVIKPIPVLNVHAPVSPQSAGRSDWVFALTTPWLLRTPRPVEAVVPGVENDGERHGRIAERSAERSIGDDAFDRKRCLGTIGREATGHLPALLLQIEPGDIGRPLTSEAGRNDRGRRECGGRRGTTGFGRGRTSQMARPPTTSSRMTASANQARYDFGGGGTASATVKPTEGPCVVSSSGLSTETTSSRNGY